MTFGELRVHWWWVYFSATIPNLRQLTHLGSKDARLQHCTALQKVDVLLMCWPDRYEANAKGDGEGDLFTRKHSSVGVNKIQPKINETRDDVLDGRRGDTDCLLCMIGSTLEFLGEHSLRQRIRIV